MPVQHAAIKALRQNIKARAKNRVVKDDLKKLAVRFRKAITAKQADTAKKVLAEYIKALDKAAQKKVIHRNAAARKQSRLIHAVKAIS